MSRRKEYGSLDDLKVIEFYKTHSTKRTQSHFHIGRKHLYEILGRQGVLPHNKETNHRFTCVERYGVPYFQNTEKSKQTKLDRYGDENYNSLQKTQDTCKMRYGETSYFKTQEFKDHVRDKISASNTGKRRSWETRQYQSRIKGGKHFSPEKLKIKLSKEYLTKKKNNSFNTSGPEEGLYNYLLRENINKTIYRQYKDENRYPYYCDFYIVEDDLFIELNAHWTHGGHPFDPNNPDDIVKLKEWERKAVKSNFYKQAIITWTQRDVEKLHTANKNHLNYIAIY